MQVLERRCGEMVQGVEEFGDKVCGVFKISKVKVNKSHITQPDNYIKDVLSQVLDIVKQGFTNIHLQLQTPNAA